MATQPADAESMSESQRQKLNKTLDTLINKCKATLSNRQATAYKAYKSARGSSSAAFELYLDCVEKVNFTDVGKKSSDFRNWKRVQKEQHSEPSFRLALRHQLNWLVLTLEAARSEGDYATMTSKVRGALNEIFSEAKQLDHNHHILKQNVLSSVFAKAYGFGSYQVKEWPTSPLNISQVYERVVFKPLREEKKASSLQLAWKERIAYQEKMIELWSPMPKSKSIGMKKTLKPPAYNKFILNERPKLIWQMEMDVFKAGDEYGAASRMITHLSNNINHNDAPKWAKELSGLIAKPKETKTRDIPDEDTTPVQ